MSLTIASSNVNLSLDGIFQTLISMCFLLGYEDTIVKELSAVNSKMTIRKIFLGELSFVIKFLAVIRYGGEYGNLR